MERGGTATTVAGIYLVVATAWIVLSTPLVAALEPWLPMSAATAELVKGLGFVVVTASLLWFVLRRSDQRLLRIGHGFRRLSDEMPVPIYVLDPERRSFDYVNPAFEELMSSLGVTGPSSPEQLQDHAYPDDHAELDLHTRLGPDAPSPLQVRMPDANGHWRLLQLHEHRAVDEHDRPILQGIIVDVTEHGRREEVLEDRLEQERATTRELEDLHQMQAAFLQAVSHELRTPLTVITGAAELLEQRHDELDAPTREELRRRLVVNAGKLSRLLTDLLDVDRLTRGVIEPNRRWVDLEALVERTLAPMDLGGRELTLQADDVWANVDAAQLERVVENLVTNAVRHTPSGTAITIAMQADDQRSELTVEDTGPGLPDERDLFAPFARGETWAPSPGTGIGLTLVRHLVELHGGEVTAQNRRGGGARFQVVLPHATAREAATAASADVSPADREP